MQLRSSDKNWGSVARWFHWGMALLIIGLMALGWTAREWPLSPTKISLFYWHKSFGMLVLGLVVARVLWRWQDRRPPLPAMSAAERRLAHLSHFLLYAVMIAMPLSGWAINSAAKIPFRVFGLFRLPAIVAPDEALQTVFEIVHLSLFSVFAALIVLHVAAALRHHFVSRDNVLRSMLFPVRKGEDEKT